MCFVYLCYKKLQIGVAQKSWIFLVLGNFNIIQNSQDKLFHSMGLTKEIEFIRYQTLDLYIVSDLN